MRPYELFIGLRYTRARKGSGRNAFISFIALMSMAGIALGVTLLDRDQKPARPTRAGEAAYSRCVAVMRATETLTRETRSSLINPAPSP